MTAPGSASNAAQANIFPAPSTPKTARLGARNPLIQRYFLRGVRFHKMASADVGFPTDAAETPKGSDREHRNRNKNIP